MTTIQKLELSDLDGYDWNWWAKYSDEVIAELVEAFIASIKAVYPDIQPLLAQALASGWAETRGATLLRLDGDENIVRLTRQRVNTLVAQTIERGDSLQTLQKAFREDFAFSRSRAKMVAQTETAKAHGQGSKAAALQQGRNEKRWMINTDIDPICVGNAAQGWIRIIEEFAGGVDTIPQHPRCECNVIYRTVDPPGVALGRTTTGKRDYDDTLVAEVRCPTCNKRSVVSNVPKGVEVYCPKCQSRFEV